MRILAALLGSLAFWLLTFMGFALVSDFQMSRPGYTQDDSDRLGGLLLLTSPVALVLGGWFGARLCVWWRRSTPDSRGP